MVGRIFFCFLEIVVILTVDSAEVDENYSNYTYKCCPDVGCFSWAPGSGFNHVDGYPPECLDKQDPKFYISTPENITLQEVQLGNLDDSTRNLQISINRHFYVIIQGFNNIFPDSGFMALGAELVAKDCNVMFVDWSNGASTEGYLLKYNAYEYKAIPNSRVIAVAISNIIKSFITTRGLISKNIHLVGHSLGAQIAGFIGAKINNIGSIIALDVAGYFFDDQDPSARLDPTDALFVQVIHTSEGYLGSTKRFGHADFFVNGGADQPLCITSKFEGLADIDPCSHRRAVDYFRWSIKNSDVACRCQMKAFPCTSKDDWYTGNCYFNRCVSAYCPIAGYSADSNTRGTFYFGTLGDQTSGADGYCGNQLKMSFKSESDIQMTKEFTFKIKSPKNPEIHPIDWKIKERDWRHRQHNISRTHIVTVPWHLDLLTIDILYDQWHRNYTPWILTEFTIVDKLGNKKFMKTPVDVDSGTTEITLIHDDSDTEFWTGKK